LLALDLGGEAVGEGLHGHGHRSHTVALTTEGGSRRPPRTFVRGTS
jgi:hypothetical protein